MKPKVSIYKDYLILKYAKSVTKGFMLGISKLIPWQVQKKKHM